MIAEKTKAPLFKGKLLNTKSSSLKTKKMEKNSKYLTYNAIVSSFPLKVSDLIQASALFKKTPTAARAIKENCPISYTFNIIVPHSCIS